MLDGPLSVNRIIYTLLAKLSSFELKHSAIKQVG